MLARTAAAVTEVDDDDDDDDNADDKNDNDDADDIHKMFWLMVLPKQVKNDPDLHELLAASKARFPLGCALELLRRRNMDII